jgi:hypothetical protein
MEIGDVFSSVLTVFKQRFGLLVMIMLAPAVFVAVGVIVLFLATIPLAVGLGRGEAPPIAAAVTLVLASLAIILVSPLLQYKAHAMITAATYEVGQGSRPTFSGLLASTKGFLPRFFPLLLLLIAAVVAVYVLLGGIIALIALNSHGNDSGMAALGAGALVFLFVIALLPVMIFFTVKLLYVVPVLTVEQLGPIASLKRSWALTRGAFWRTLGYYLLAALAVSAVGSVASGVLQIGMVPFMATMENADTSAEIMAGLAALVPIMVASVLVQVVLQLLTTPFLYSYTSVMYIDQVRRSLLPPAPPPVQWQPGYPPSSTARPATGWQAPPPVPPNPVPPNPVPPNVGQPPQPGSNPS